MVKKFSSLRFTNYIIVENQQLREGLQLGSDCIFER